MPPARQKNSELTPLSTAIRAMRQAFGESQSRFAERLGLSLPTVQRYESNTEPPSLEVLTLHVDREIGVIAKRLEALKGLEPTGPDSEEHKRYVKLQAEPLLRSTAILAQVRRVFELYQTAWDESRSNDHRDQMSMAGLKHCKHLEGLIVRLELLGDGLPEDLVAGLPFFRKNLESIQKFFLLSSPGFVAGELMSDHFLLKPVNKAAE